MTAWSSEKRFELVWSASRENSLKVTLIQSMQSVLAITANASSRTLANQVCKKKVDQIKIPSGHDADPYVVLVHLSLTFDDDT